ncbi:MAG TPA: IMP cyclohydrolase, partial [Dehalococcoidales bacterium]|nr:IMP cyclohydrolase [Dehalococcoidales bacterium]
MQNPNGPYPGRQLFVGLNPDNVPSLVYLVTGRSPASRERMAAARDNGIIIGPIGNAAYDPLRHYTGIKFDDVSGVAAVSNGIQTDAVFEAYKLLFNVGSAPDTSFIEKLMEGAKAEPDSLNTPRISAVITKNADKPVMIVAIKKHDLPAKSFVVKLEAGVLTGISTYTGDMEKPAGYDVGKGAAKLKIDAKTPAELAKSLYELSAAAYNGDDIRVCAVGGMYINGKWQIS